MLPGHELGEWSLSRVGTLRCLARLTCGAERCLRTGKARVIAAALTGGAVSCRVQRRLPDLRLPVLPPRAANVTKQDLTPLPVPPSTRCRQGCHQTFNATGPVVAAAALRAARCARLPRWGENPIADVPLRSLCCLHARQTMRRGALLGLGRAAWLHAPGGNQGRFPAPARFSWNDGQHKGMELA